MPLLLVGAAIGCLAYWATAPEQEEQFDHGLFIEVCRETGGSPRVVEADVSGLVMNCVYPDDMSGTFGETRHEGRA